MTRSGDTRCDGIAADPLRRRQHCLARVGNPLHDGNPAVGRSQLTRDRVLPAARLRRSSAGCVRRAAAASTSETRHRRVAVRWWRSSTPAAGLHPGWTSVVTQDVNLDGVADRLLRRTSVSPEDDGDQSGPLDGSIDPISGHGTFIAGLVRQRCPDADHPRLAGDAVRMGRSSSPTWSPRWPRSPRLVAPPPRGEPGGRPIDVLSLSMGYYHETPEDELFDPTMYEILEEMLAATARRVVSLGRQRRHPAGPLFPAGCFTRWS